ncbi:5'-nucleotidase C-terminal domain-containing protein [Lewinella lacunae]|uniref:5'-nucleotidase C-terminal domain-containing protein n=2 Tax=Neolewinella lacunae TaxID=1517758 RepID=A0A923T7A3_9BACT|nr:5'-nucleotidase C-terminal domain-containing protein [Neolewinella lacunae]
MGSFFASSRQLVLPCLFLFKLFLMRLLIAALFSLFLSLGFWSCSVPQAVAPAPSAPVEFIVLQLNDVYEIAPLEGGTAGGLARVATVRQELLRENPNVITVMAGDFLSPSFLGTMSYTNDAGERERIAGLQMVETLNAMGLDYATFGNHEFDLKDLALLEKRMDQSTFRYTVCNALAVTEGGNARPFAQNGQAVPEYLVHEVAAADGRKLRVGIVGVVLPFNKADYVRYADATDAFRKTLPQVEAASDLVLAITHQSVEEDEALAAAVPGVPLFIGGHEHAKLSRYVDQTAITKADANAKTVYIHRISYDPVSRRSVLSSTLRKIDQNIADEPGTKAVVDKWVNQVFSLMEDMGYDPTKEVLQLTEPLVCKEELIRTSATNYGQLTMEAIAKALPGADLYVLNSGSMRLDDNLFNIVTEYDVLRTFPYGGNFVTLQMPGSAVTQLLQTGLKTNYGDGGYLQQRNADPETFALSGQAIDPTKTYSVVMPEFMAQGKEANLDFLKGYYQGNPAKTLTVGTQTLRNDLRDIVIYHMQELGTY